MIAHTIKRETQWQCPVCGGPMTLHVFRNAASPRDKEYTVVDTSYTWSCGACRRGAQP